MSAPTTDTYPSRCRRSILIVLIVWISLTLVLIGYKDQMQFPTIVKNMFIKIYPSELGYSITSPISYNFTTEDDGCKGFNIDPVHKSIIKYFKRKPRLKCNTSLPNLLYATDDGKYLKIDKSKTARLNVAKSYCKYSSLRRYNGVSDFKVSVSAWSKSFTDFITLPADVEHIWGQCFQGAGKLVGNGYLSVIRKNSTVEKVLEESYKLHMKKENPKETLSVLLIGIDGTSKQNFARAMPKTRSYVLQEMGGIEMYKLNKVGLNTFPNVVAMLTGMPSEDVRKLWNDKEFLDKIDHLFLWDEARLAGYRTSMILDRIKITSFHYLKQGWKNPKFHFNNRPVVVKSEVDKVARKPNRYCVGDVNEISLFYDYWLQLTRTYNNSKETPYFAYSFFSHVTHDDINMASTVDEVYLKLFHNLAGQNSLNNTLVVFFSDHGSRYGSYRSTFKGMLEDSNPFMVFIFPPWFKSKYPKLTSNFKYNQHRLLTSFDVHATLKDVLHFQGDDLLSRKINKTRGLSLFQKLPVKRTCQEAGVPIKFCNCRNFSESGITPDLSHKVSQQFLKSVVLKSKTFRSQCVALSLHSTLSVMTIYTTSKVDDFYQATIKTSPGGAVYEATLKKKKASGGGLSVVGDIARVNMYRGQADCIKDARIRPFCYCRNLLSSHR